MPKEHHYYVYILSSRSRTLYIGITRNLTRRVAQHREGKHDSFTRRYRIHRLVYVESFQYVNNAITREKYLKHLTRAEKLTLIATINPTWIDLAAPPNPARTNPQSCHPSPKAEDLIVPAQRPEPNPGQPQTDDLAQPTPQNDYHRDGIAPDITGAKLRDSGVRSRPKPAMSNTLRKVPPGGEPSSTSTEQEPP